MSWRGKAAVRIRGLSKTFRPFGKPAVHAVKGNAALETALEKPLNGP